MRRAPRPQRRRKGGKKKEGWMPTEVIMPQMGESIFEGTITRWLKKPGDTVEKDEPLLEISTDKVDAEIPSPVSGILTEIRVPEGVTVEINAVLAIIGGPSVPSQVPGTTTPPAQKSAPPQVAQKPAPPQAAPKARAAATQLPTPQVLPHSGRIVSSPLARRIAREHGLDLSHITGSG